MSQCHCVMGSEIRPDLADPQNSRLAGYEVIQCELVVDEVEPPAERALLGPSL